MSIGTRAETLFYSEKGIKFRQKHRGKYDFSDMMAFFIIKSWPQLLHASNMFQNKKRDIPHIKSSFARLDSACLTNS